MISLVKGKTEISLPHQAWSNHTTFPFLFIRHLLTLLCSIALSACAGTTINLTPSPQAPLCQETTAALVLWAPEWRPDQKDVNEREAAATTGLHNFFAESACFAHVEVRRIPTREVNDVSMLVASEPGRFSRFILIVVHELGPVVKLLSSPLLLEGGTEVVLRVAEFSAETPTPTRQFVIHWRNGGPGVIKGVDSLPADMKAALLAVFQPQIAKRHE